MTEADRALFVDQVRFTQTEAGARHRPVPKPLFATALDLKENHS